MKVLFCKEINYLSESDMKRSHLIFDVVSFSSLLNFKTGNRKAELVFPSYVVYLSHGKQVCE